MYNIFNSPMKTLNLDNFKLVADIDFSKEKEAIH